MTIYVSIRQLLLYQMGYLLFNKLNQDKEENTSIRQRLQVLQSAFEALKSYHHNKHYQSITTHFVFLDEDELKELNDGLEEDLNPDAPPTQYVHPMAFGMWLEEQTFVNLGRTGTMDDSEMTKGIWRQLTGSTFIKLWKKQKINSKHIIQKYADDIDEDIPYIDISITNNSAVRAADFRESLCRNPIIEISLDQQPSNGVNGLSANTVHSLSSSSNMDSHSNKENHVNSSQILQHPAFPAKPPGVRTRSSVDHGHIANGQSLIQNGKSCKTNGKSLGKSLGNINGNTSNMESISEHNKASGINLFDTVENANTFRIACCILWEPQLAHDVLLEFVRNPCFEVDGIHKKIEPLNIDETMIRPPSPGISGSGGLTPLGFHGRATSAEHDDDVYEITLPMVAAQLIAPPLMGTMAASMSVQSSPGPPSVCSGHMSSVSAATSYIGAGYLQPQCDMPEDDIYKYLMEMDYNDKKNPVKYEWKMMVDALNAFQFKVVAIDDYTDDDILKMVNRMKEGLVNSIHDQRSGLIKVACNLFILIAQYRTPLFVDEKFFKFWMVCLLRKCANRDKIRTLPAHTACRDIVACILSFYVNNKDNSKEFLLHKLADIFVIFSSLWTPDDIDPLWMKQMKSVTQFIKTISLMIEHTAVLHQAPPNKVDEMQFQIEEIAVAGIDSKSDSKTDSKSDSTSSSKTDSKSKPKTAVISNVAVDINVDKKESTEQHEGDQGDGVNENVTVKPIENQDIKRMQDIAFDLFEKFYAQPHKEARDCASRLLINLYKLERERTFEFAKGFYGKRELRGYLQKLQKLDILSDEHKEYLEKLSARGGRTRIRKGSGKKKSKKGGDRSVSSEIKKMKKAKKKKKRNSKTSSIPEDTTTDHEVGGNVDVEKSKLSSDDVKVSGTPSVEKKNAEEVMLNQSSPEHTV